MSIKLSVYRIDLKPQSANKRDKNSIKYLIKYLTNTIGQETTDSHDFLELFRLFIEQIDKPDMITDAKSKKTITGKKAAEIEEGAPNPNINPDSGRFFIHGTIEGGIYGRVRRKILTTNREVSDSVNENEAITDRFYFLLYAPVNSNKAVLLIQSYGDNNVDSVVRFIFNNIFYCPGEFNHPKIDKFIPKTIINRFKNTSVVNSLTYSTEVLGNTLSTPVQQQEEATYKVTVKIEATDGAEINMNDFDSVNGEVSKKSFLGKLIGSFSNKRGSLKNTTTNRVSSFDIEDDFNIKPVIFLSDLLPGIDQQMNFHRIEEFCISLLENEIKREIYPGNAIQER